jgi:two-component system nitrogen regulation sensor histidine kinase NtrY
MISRTYRWSLIIRLLIFALLSGCAAFFLVQNFFFLFILCLSFLAVSGGELVYYYTSMNRKIAFFFDAVRNEDSTLHFPENVHNPGVRKLHQSLNQLNQIISEIKIRNEHNERFYRQLLKYSATGILAVDEKGYIDLANDAALQLMGLKHIAHIRLLEQKNPVFYNSVTRMKPGHTQLIKMLEGEEIRQLSIKVTRQQLSQKWYTIYSLYDIKAELEENELDTWQKLIRILTHEIMNSIAPITSLSNTLGRIIKSEKTGKDGRVSTVDREKTIEGLKVIEETGKGLMHFIDNYRKLTKIPKPVFKSIRIPEWLSRVELLMKERLASEKVHFEMIIKSKQKELIADEKLLSQVLINIINNAIDAVKRKKNKSIHLTVTNDKRGKLQVSVTDNGHGIREDEIDKIFIPFYTTRESGSGIGLSLSRQIMRLHKGSISVNSVYGRYSTISLKF